EPPSPPLHEADTPPRGRGGGPAGGTAHLHERGSLPGHLVRAAGPAACAPQLEQPRRVPPAAVAEPRTARAAAPGAARPAGRRPTVRDFGYLRCPPLDWLTSDPSAGHPEPRRRLLLEVHLEPGQRRNALVRAQRLDGVGELDVDAQVVAEVSSEGREDVLQYVVRVASCFGDPEGDRVRALLDHLVALDGVVEVLEVVGEEAAGKVLPVGPLDDRLDPALDLADERETAPTRARNARVDSDADISEPVANEGQAVVVQVRDHELAHLPGRDGLAVAEYLDDERLSDHVVPRVRRALVGDAGELAGPVLVEHPAAEGRLDQAAARLGQRLPATHDRLRAQGDLAPALQIARKEIERLGVSFDQHGLPGG